MAHGERVETEAVAEGQEDEAVVAVIAVVTVTMDVAAAVIVVEALPVIVAAALVVTENASKSLSCRDLTSLPSTRMRRPTGTKKERRRRIRPLRRRRRSN
jgi:hypothetical protein